MEGRTQGRKEGRTNNRSIKYGRDEEDKELGTSI